MKVLKRRLTGIGIIFPLNQCVFKLDELEFQSSEDDPDKIGNGSNYYLCNSKNYMRSYIPLRGHAGDKGAFPHEKTD